MQSISESVKAKDCKRLETLEFKKDYQITAIKTIK